eukprot:1163235-Prorocentrum_minimum.AAC.5
MRSTLERSQRKVVLRGWGDSLGDMESPRGKENLALPACGTTLPLPIRPAWVDLAHHNRTMA